MTFMDFYIVDPLETCEESMIYSGFNDMEYDYALEGIGSTIVKGFRVALDALKRFFQKIGRFFERRVLIISSRISVFIMKSRGELVIPKETYKNLQKAIPTMVKLVQNVSRIARTSGTKVTMDDKIEGISDLIATYSYMGGAHTPDTLGTDTPISHQEAAKILEVLKGLNKTVAESAKFLEKETDKVNRMSDDDPKKEEAVNALKEKQKELNSVQKWVGIVNGLSDQIRQKSSDNTDK